MVTTTTKSKRPTAAKAASSNYVDFDEFIEFQLKKTRSGIHHTDILASGVMLATFLAGYLLLFTIFDHWIVPGGLSELSRLALLGVVSLVTVAWLVLKIVIPLYRQVNVLYAVREIERSYPELESSLLSWVQLRDAGRQVSPDILQALEKRAALQMERSDVDRAVDRRLLMKCSYVLLGIVVAICLYTVFSPKKISNSMWRAFVPATSVAASTKTEIVDVLPGHAEVLARDFLDHVCS